MARAPSTTDVFAAVAEPRRRAILEALAGAERPVGDVVEALGWDQPSVSKHLRVLREAGVVTSRKRGRQRLYRVNAEELRVLRDWTAAFERYWDDTLDRIRRDAEGAAWRPDE